MRHLAPFASCLALAGCASEKSPSDLASLEAVTASYRVEATMSAPVTAGSTAQMTIQVLAGDVPVTHFDDLHTQTMHVVGVSSDLRDFFHVHPTLGTDGFLRVGAPIAKAQPYQFFFEYDPAGPSGEQTSRTKLLPLEAVSVAPELASEMVFDGSVQRSSSTETTRLELAPVSHGMLMSGMSVTLRVAVKTPAGGDVTDLVDWLGMPGHAIVLSEDTSTFIHAHAMRPGSGGDGGHGGHGGHGGMNAAGAGASNVLDVELTLPRAGLYKMFVQVKRNQEVVTAPFVLKSVAM